MNPEFETLLAAAIADGQITEKERAILMRKAAQLGMDPDEAELIIDGRLHQAQLDNASLSKAGSNKSQVCPSCGEPLESFIARCPACGHELSDKQANKLITEIEDRLSQVEQRFRERLSIPMKSIARFEVEQERDRAMEAAIENIPIPTQKEDLIELVSFCYPKRSNLHLGSAYKAKYEECISKLEVLGIKDKSLATIANQFRNRVEVEDKKQKKFLAFVGIPLLILIILIIIFH